MSKVQKKTSVPKVQQKKSASKKMVSKVAKKFSNVQKKNATNKIAASNITNMKWRLPSREAPKKSQRYHS